MPRSKKRRFALAFSAVALVAVGVVWVWPATDTGDAGQSPGSVALQSRQVVGRIAERPQVDAFGDPLPVRALLRIGSRRLQHRAVIRQIAFSSHDGTVAAVGQAHDRDIRLWDARTGVLKQHLTGPEAVQAWRESVIAMDCSRDGTKLAALHSNESIRLWDMQTGREIYTVPSNERSRWGPTRAVGFSPDGSRFATTRNEVIRVWETDTGKEIVSFRMPGLTVEGAGQPRRVFPNAQHIAFSHDGQLLAAASDGPAVIGVWNLQSGDRQAVITEAHVGDLRSLAALADTNHVVSAGCRETPAAVGETGQEPPATERILEIRIWDLETGRLVREFEPEVPAAVMGRMQLTKNGRMLAVRYAKRGDDGWERWFDLREVSSGRHLQSIPASRRTSSSLFGFTNDDMTFAAAEENRLRLWDVSTGEPLIAESGQPSSRIVDATFGAGGEVVITGEVSGQISGWDAQTGRLLYQHQPAEGFRQSLDALSVSHDGRILATCRVTDRQFADLIHSVELWDAARGTLLRELSPPSGWFISAELPTFSPDGSQLAVYEPSREQSATELVSLWSVETGRLVRDIELPLGNQSRRVVALQFSPDGRSLYTIGGDAIVHTWDVSSGAQLAQFEADNRSSRASPYPQSPASIESAEFLRSLERVATSSDRRVVIWDLQNGETLATIVTPGRDGPRLLTQSPDGTRLVTAETRLGRSWHSDAIRLWDVASGRVLLTLEPIDAAAARLALSPDGTRLAAAMDCGTVIVWDVTTGP